MEKSLITKIRGLVLAGSVISDCGTRYAIYDVSTSRYKYDKERK